MIKALVACAKNSRNLQEVPYTLKKGGCDVVDVLCSKRSSLLQNSHHDSWIEYDKERDDFKAMLFDAVQNNNYDWIILGDDTTLKIMNDAIHDEQLFKKILPMNKMEHRAMLSSKIGLSQVCEKLSIVTPKYIVIENESQLDEAVLRLRFPVLTKVDVSQGGRGIHYCNNADELKRVFAQHDHNYNLIVQEFIKGRDIGAEALYKDGKLLAYNVCEVLEYLEGAFGRTSKRRYFYSTDVEKLLLELGEKAGLNGFASIQYIHDESENLYYLVESDLRPNIWVASSRFTGNDFTAAIKRYLNLLPVTEDCYKPKNYNNTYIVALFNRDVARCVKKGDLLDFFKWIFSYKYWKFIPTYDRKLFRYQMKNTYRDSRNSIIVNVKKKLKLS